MGKDIESNRFLQTETAQQLVPEQKNFPWQFLNWKVRFIWSLRWLGQS